MLGMNQGSNKVRISSKICRSRFRFDESMLMGLNLYFKWCETCYCMIISNILGKLLRTGL